MIDQSLFTRDIYNTLIRAAVIGGHINLVKRYEEKKRITVGTGDEEEMRQLYAEFIFDAGTNFRFEVEAYLVNRDDLFVV